MKITDFNKLPSPAANDVIVGVDVSEDITKKIEVQDLPVSNATQTALDAKQDTLVSGVDIKTVNSQSLLGSGNITVTSSYMIPIWAEENSTLDNSTYEWAFGNGADTPQAGGITIYIPTGQTAKIVAMTSKSGSSSANSVIALEVNGVNQYSNGYSVQMYQGKGLIEFLTPYELVSGDVVNFRTQLANNTYTPNTATLWIMYSPSV